MDQHLSSNLDSTEQQGSQENTHFERADLVDQVIADLFETAKDDDSSPSSVSAQNGTEEVKTLDNQGGHQECYSDHSHLPGTATLLEQPSTINVTETTKAVCFKWITHPCTKRWQEETQNFSNDRTTYPKCPKNIGLMIINALVQVPNGILGFLICVDQNNKPRQRVNDMGGNTRGKNKCFGKCRLASFDEISTKTEERFGEGRTKRFNNARKRSRGPQIVQNAPTAATAVVQQEPPSEKSLPLALNIPLLFGMALSIENKETLETKDKVKLVSIYLSIDNQGALLKNEDKAKLGRICYDLGCLCDEQQDEALAKVYFEKCANVCDTLPPEWAIPT